MFYSPGQSLRCRPSGVAGGCIIIRTFEAHSKVSIDITCERHVETRHKIEHDTVDSSLTGGIHNTPVSSRR